MSRRRKWKNKNRRKKKQKEYLAFKFIVKKQDLEPADVKKIDLLTHESKNLFNRALYLIYKELNESERWIRYNELWRTLKDSGEVEEYHDRNNFRFLKTGVIQQILRQIDAMWKSYFEAIEEWKVAWRGENYDNLEKRKPPEEPWRFTQVPQKPFYKKKDGHFMLIFSYNDITIKDNKMIINMMNTFKQKHPDLTEQIIITIPKHENFDFFTSRKEKNFQHVKILPRKNFYQIDIVYKRAPIPDLGLDYSRYIAIDVGVNNLITAVENRCVRPIIISGKPIKHENWYYNKQKARLQSLAKKQGINWENELEDVEIRAIQAVARKCEENWSKLLKRLKHVKKQKIIDMEGNEWLKGLNRFLVAKIQSLLDEKGQYWTERLDALLSKRNSYMEDYFHQVTTAFIQYCVENKIGKIVLPKLKHIKKFNDLGKRNNQNFHYIPLDKLRKMIIYKAELVGIKVYDEVTEWYTSKVSSLDLEPICKHDKYIGKRIKSVENQEKGRGLFKGSNYILNSDVNGALNILRKVIRDDRFIIDLRDTGCWFQPIRIKSVEELTKLHGNRTKPTWRSYVTSRSSSDIT